MKILIFTPILFDETSPFNHLFKDILLKLLQEGHTITRVVATDNYKNQLYKMELEQITYIPIKRKKTKKKNVFSRFILDNITAIRMKKYIKRIDFDVLLEDISYTSAWFLKPANRKKAKIVSMVQDVWPDNVALTGLIKENSFLFKYFDKLQKKMYKYSDRIVAISDDMKKLLISKGVLENKISVAYNWGYSDDLFSISNEKNKFLIENGLDTDKLYVVYAGNIGRLQNVEVVVEAARKVKDLDDICFLIVGTGAMLDNIKKISCDLPNLIFLPFQNSDMAKYIYSAAFINVVPLIKGAIKTALPSKTGVILSCGKRTVFCFGKDSEFNKNFSKYDTIDVIDSGDSDNLVDIIKNEYFNEKKEILNYEPFLDYFTKEKNTQIYIKVINSVKELVI